MTQPTGYLRFIKDNAPFLATGALLSFLSVFGQTFFISIFGGEIRHEFALSNGDWGLLYMVGTAASAALMVFAGSLADVFRVRTLGIAVVVALSVACYAMSVTTSIFALCVLIFFLRFLGQGMATHMAMVAMARWFVVSRGRALAMAGLGFLIGEATLPLIMVWLKSHIYWRDLWVAFAVFCLLSCLLLFRLLRLERTPQSIATTQSSLGMNGKHWTRREVLCHPLFWLIVPATVFMSGFGTAFWFHQVHFAEIKGWSHLALVSVFPLGTITVAGSTIIYGWAIDRFGASRLLPFYILPYVVAFILHWYAPSLWWVAVGVIFMGLAGGGQATLLSACWAEFYGTRYIGSIKAAAAAMMVLGSALGPGLSGWLIDIGVGFEVQMLGYAACFAGSSILLGIASRMHARLTVAP